MKATPENTAVVSITSYTTGWRPETYDYFLHSAKRVGIEILTIERQDTFTNNYTDKIEKFIPDVKNLPSKYEFILYVDSRDIIFARGLADICDTFNCFGWPIVMGATKTCHPHADSHWAARFGDHGTGFNFPNAGAWMGERSAIESALSKLPNVKRMIEEGAIKNTVPFLTGSDQFIWQAAYVEKMFPIGLDHASRLFFNFPHAMYLGDTLDFKRCKQPNPLVTKLGSTPCIAHFTGHKSFAIPYFYKLLLLDELNVQLDHQNT